MAIKSEKLSLKVFTEKRPPLGSYEPALSPKTKPDSFSHPEDAFDLKKYIEDVIEENTPVLVSGYLAPIFPTGTAQLLTNTGAINLTSYFTRININAATTDIAFTLANGTILGQSKIINLFAVGVGGRAIVTLTNASLSNTLIFENAGEEASLIWNGTEWTLLNFS